MDLSNENIIHIKKEEIEYIQFKKLLKYPEVKHAYVIGLDKSFKIYLNPNEEEKAKNVLAEKSYKAICEELGLEYNNIVNTMQQHTDNIQIVDRKKNIDKPDFNMYVDTDGLISDKGGIVLSTINADCILLIFYDPAKKVISDVHSGWKGTLKRISVKAVQKMQKKYGCDPKDIICCMSPSIRKDHFEVDEDVYELFANEFIDLKKYEKEIYFKNNENKYNIDTIEINRLILQKEGLKPENIIDSGICSVCNKDIIHSYRAHGKEAGRETFIISLDE